MQLDEASTCSTTRRSRGRRRRARPEVSRPSPAPDVSPQACHPHFRLHTTFTPTFEPSPSNPHLHPRPHARARPEVRRPTIVVGPAALSASSRRTAASSSCPPTSSLVRLPGSRCATSTGARPRSCRAVLGSARLACPPSATRCTGGGTAAPPLSVICPLRHVLHRNTSDIP